MEDIEKAKYAWNRERGESFRNGSTDYNLLEKTPGEYYIYIKPSGSITAEPKDWERNFDALPTKMLVGTTKVYVHRGFKAGYDELIADVLPRLKNPTKVEIVGYSQGAALALLLYVHLKTTIVCEIPAPVLFGCPKPFAIYNIWGARYVKQLCKDVLTVRAGNDCVSRVPFTWLGYIAVGKELKIKVHHKKHDLVNYIISLFRDHGAYYDVL